MPSRTGGRTKRARTPLRRPVVLDDETPHISSGTAMVLEGLRTGVGPAQPAVRHSEEIPHESEAILVGDPDDSVLENEYAGEDTPGGSTPTPDQNDVDAIGRVYGLQEEDSGALRSGAEVLSRRDRHRSELLAPRRPRS